MKQWHLLFDGRVQGVGFRYTVAQKAKSLGVFGWVKNLPDGRVESVWEAEEAVLEALMNEVQDHFANYIVDHDAQLRDATTKYSDFNIVY